MSSDGSAVVSSGGGGGDKGGDKGGVGGESRLGVGGIGVGEAGEGPLPGIVASLGRASHPPRGGARLTATAAGVWRWR